MYEFVWKYESDIDLIIVKVDYNLMKRFKDSLVLLFVKFVNFYIHKVKNYLLHITQISYSCILFKVIKNEKEK